MSRPALPTKDQAEGSYRKKASTRHVPGPGTNRRGHDEPAWLPIDGGGPAPEYAATSDVGPVSCSCRIANRFDQALDPIPLTKPERFDPPTNDGGSKSSDLDCLQFVEADLVARCGAESVIRLVLRSALDFLETAQSGRACRFVQVQLVQPFLAEQERASRAVNLEIMLHLAASCAPVGLDRTTKESRQNNLSNQVRGVKV